MASIESDASGSWPELVRGLPGTLFVACLAVFGASLLGILTRSAGDLAMIWPANALTLGLLLRLPQDRRAAIWLAAPIGFVAADMVAGADVTRAFLLGAANLCGIAAAYAATRFIPESALKLREPQSVLWYVIVAAAGASAAGLFAAVAEPFPLGLGRFGMWEFRFASELINYIALLPMIVSMPPMRSLLSAHPSFASPLDWRGALPVTTLIGTCALALFAGGPGAIVFAVPSLIWCGLTYSVFFVSVLAFAFALWSSIVIGVDHLHSIAGALDGGAAVSLRLAASMIALAPITLAIVMRHRDELVQKLLVAGHRVDMALRAGSVVGIWDLNVAAETITVEALYPDSHTPFRREWSIERAMANIHPDDRERVYNELYTAVATGTDYHCKYHDVALAHERWLATFGKPVFDQRNAVSHLIGVFIDLTQQTKTAEALEISDKRFDIVAESIPDIVWSTDADGRHDYFNRRWHEFTGIAPDDLAPETWTGLVHPADERRVMETWAACLQTGQAYAIDYRFRHHDGTYRWLRVQAKPLRNAQGAIVRWYGTSTDIDDAKQLEAEREMVARELDHRIGNLFALVNGLVNLTVRDGSNVKAVTDALRGRLRMLHDAHGLIRRSQDASAATMTALLRRLLAPYDNGKDRIAITGDDLAVDPSAITSLALIFHELATNAVKYGALNDGDGALRIELSRIEDHFRIRWLETSHARAAAGQGTGFGSKLFDAIIEGQLRGKAARSASHQGLAVEIDLPISSLAGSARRP